MSNSIDIPKCQVKLTVKVSQCQIPCDLQNDH
jgi:hypothetical protein